MLTVQGSLDSARVATIASLNATYANGLAGVSATLTDATAGVALVIDGVGLAAGERVLVKDQASSFQNGAYLVTNPGSIGVPWVLTRDADFDSPAEITAGTFVFVLLGTVNGGKSWIQTAVVTAVGTSAITFESTQSVLYTFLPGTLVFVVNAGTFGIAKATISTVAISQAPMAVPAVSYTVAYSNPTRPAAAVLAGNVFSDLNDALAFYAPLIT